MLKNKSGRMDETCFANVALPLDFTKVEQEDGRNEKQERIFGVEEAGKIGAWINKAAVEEYDTYLQIAFHSSYLWVRLSAQVYLEPKDFEWVGHKLAVLCSRLRSGEAVS